MQIFTAGQFRILTQVVTITALLVGSWKFAHAQEGSVQHVHDPVIARDGNKFFLFSTGKDIPVRTSADLFSWSPSRSVFSRIPDWALHEVPEAKNIWAPDISFFNNKFHLYYSISTFGSKQSCIGLATTPSIDPNSPNYKWTDAGLVVKSDSSTNYNCIDPNIVLDGNKMPWLSFGSHWGGIQLVSINPKTGKPSGRVQGIAKRPSTAIEAPFIIRRQSLYYLFVSFDQCCKGVDSTYKVMVGRARQVQGPYVDATGKPMLDGGGTLVLAGYRSIKGPGHNAVITVGESDYLVHHFYDQTSNGVPTLQIRPIIWESGWPLVGEPISDGDLEDNRKSKLIPSSILGTWDHYVEDGRKLNVELKPGGIINAGRATWSFTNKTLELRWPKGGAGSGEWVDRCIVSPNGDWYVGRNGAGALIRGVKR